MALEPEADKARTVIDYGRVQILSARGHVQIALKVKPPRGMPWCLKDAGFKQASRNLWQRPFNTDAIMQAQAIVNTFFPQQEIS